MFFQRIYYICFRFLFLVLFLCLFLVLMLVSILLLMLLGRPWGILSPFLSFSGMPFSCFSCSFGWLGAYFFLTFLFLVCFFLAFHTLSDAPRHTFPFSFILWYVYLAVFETYAKMIDARHLTGLSLDRIFYQADCA